MTFEIISQ